MLYSNVYIDSFGYELAPNVVTSEDIEKRLEPLYKALHFQKGQLQDTFISICLISLVSGILPSCIDTTCPRGSLFFI